MKRLLTLWLLAALLFTACGKDATDPAPDPQPAPPPASVPAVSLSGGLEFYEEFHGMLELSLDAPSGNPVTVTVTRDDTVLDAEMTPLPDDAITFTRSVTIPAGSTAAKIIVEVNALSLDAGEYAAGLGISAEGAEVAAEGHAALIYCLVEGPGEDDVVILDISAPDAFTDSRAEVGFDLTAPAPAGAYADFSLIFNQRLADEGCTIFPKEAVSVEGDVTYDEAMGVYRVALTEGARQTRITLVAEASLLDAGTPYQLILYYSGCSGVQSDDNMAGLYKINYKR